MHDNDELQDAWIALEIECLRIADAPADAIERYPDFQEALGTVEKLFVERFSQLSTQDARRMRKLIKVLRDVSPSRLGQEASHLAHRISHSHEYVSESERLDENYDTGDSEISAEIEAARHDALRNLKRNAASVSDASDPRPLPRMRPSTLMLGLGLALWVGVLAWMIVNWVTKSEEPGEHAHSQKRVVADATINSDSNQPLQSATAFLAKDGIQVQVNLLPYGDLERATMISARSAALPTLIEFLDREFSTNPKGYLEIEKALVAVTSDDAKWKEHGTSGALADELALELNLSRYASHRGVLPSEVASSQGGDDLGLAVLYVAMQSRLGIRSEGVIRDPVSARTYPRLAGGVPFVAPGRDQMSLKSGQEADLSRLLLEELIRREADAGNPRVSELVSLYSLRVRSVDKELLDRAATDLIQGIFQKGRWKTTEDRRAIREMSKWLIVDEASMTLLVSIAELLWTETPIAITFTIHSTNPERIFRNRVSVSEFYLTQLAASNVEDSAEFVRGLLDTALSVTPGRINEIVSIAEKMLPVEDDLFADYCHSLYVQGQTQYQIARPLAKRALKRGAPIQALMYLSTAVLRDDFHLLNSHDQVQALLETLILVGQTGEASIVDRVRRVKKSLSLIPPELEVAEAMVLASLGRRSEAEVMLRKLKRAEPEYPGIDTCLQHILSK